MKESIYSILIISVMTLIPQAARSAELIVNGGFETGNFTGWTFINPSGGWHNRAVTQTGLGGDDCGGCTFTLPSATNVIFGTRNAWNGVTAGPNQSYILYQDVSYRPRAPRFFAGATATR